MSGKEEGSIEDSVLDKKQKEKECNDIFTI